MQTNGRKIFAGLAIVMLVLGGCATAVEEVVRAPRVELTGIQVMGLGFNGQTFQLSFTVHNPNPFSLPIESIDYDIRLAGQRFASGGTVSALSVPAGGDSRFAMSVDLDLLQTAPQLLSIVRDGVRKDIPYELRGEFGLDLPLSPAVRYRTDGAIRLRSDSF